jgi:hypothetical protein
MTKLIGTLKNSQANIKKPIAKSQLLKANCQKPKANNQPSKSNYL